MIFTFLKSLMALLLVQKGLLDKNFNVRLNVTCLIKGGFYIYLKLLSFFPSDLFS